jgi:hypothetical protein
MGRGAWVGSYLEPFTRPVGFPPFCWNTASSVVLERASSTGLKPP